MNAELAFRLLLGALSLAGIGLFFIFYLLFEDEREIDPIYRRHAERQLARELSCELASDAPPTECALNLKSA